MAATAWLKHDSCDGIIIIPAKAISPARPRHAPLAGVRLSPERLYCALTPTLTVTRCVFPAS